MSTANEYTMCYAMYFKNEQMILLAYWPDITYVIALNLITLGNYTSIFPTLSNAENTLPKMKYTSSFQLVLQKPKDSALHNNIMYVHR